MLIYFFEKNSIFLHIQICIGYENIDLSPFKLLVFGPETAANLKFRKYLTKVLPGNSLKTCLAFI